MDSFSSFAEASATPDAIIAQVRRQVGYDLSEDATLEGQEFDRVVESAVRDLWRGRVKSFVPVLALREARDFLREQRTTPPAASVAPAGGMRKHTEPLVRDAIGLDDDVFQLSADDTMRF